MNWACASYRVLPDEAELNLNMRIAGVKHYSAEVSVVRHKLVHTTGPAPDGVKYSTTVQEE